MEKCDIRGTGVALVTPFKEDSSVDFEALERIVDHVVEGGVDFVVALGTTAETSMLTHEEKGKVIEVIVRKVAGRVPVVLGYGGICTAQMFNDFSQYDFTGISALLVVTPYYVKPSQRGLVKHYTTLADASPLPIILYNVPGRTGINMEADTTLELASHKNIIGIKEASGKLFQIEQILLERPKDFLVFSGDDALTFHLVNAGADGVISVSANALPREISTIVDSIHVNDSTRSRDIHLSLKELTKSLFIDGNPAGIKYLLSVMNICKNVLRSPLVGVEETTARRIDRQYREFLDTL